MSDENKLMFSFLPLINQSFKFIVYRKLLKPQESLGLYCCKLPITNASEKDWPTYSISFIPANEYDEFECDVQLNWALTNRWLSEILKKKLEQFFEKHEYNYTDKFGRRFEFIIEEHKEGYEIVKLEPYYLGIPGSFGFLLDFSFKVKKGFKNSKNVGILSLSLDRYGNKNKNFYVDKYNKIMLFIKEKIPRIFPIENIDVHRELFNVPFYMLEGKRYVFNNNTISLSQFDGLKRYHPYKGIDSSPLFVFIFEKSKVNTARELFKALRGDAYPTFPGMNAMFGVPFQNDNIKSIQMQCYSDIKELLNTEKVIDEILAENPKRKIVGIFVGISRDFDTNSEYSPYYLIKHIFLKKGLAIQAVTIEQSLKKDGFKWSVAGIALQLFVKLGGIPWKVVPSNNNCIIFGISSAHRRNMNGEINRYFAYSVCIDSDGTYQRLDFLADDTNREKFMQQLSDRIKEVIISRFSSKTKKCVIHMPFKLQKKEIQCIQDSIKEIKDLYQNIEFVFIKVNTDNRFFGYSHSNSRIPLAGSYIQLSKHEFLVWFEGLQSSRQTVSASNISSPIHIQFSGNKEMSDVSIKLHLQDIINLSGANWRGFNAKNTPISIYYPELIAKFISKFDEYNLDLDVGKAAEGLVWFV